jgi:hypothetical protein
MRGRDSQTIKDDLTARVDLDASIADGRERLHPPPNQHVPLRVVRCVFRADDASFAFGTYGLPPFCAYRARCDGSLFVLSRLLVLVLVFIGVGVRKGQWGK